MVTKTKVILFSMFLVGSIFSCKKKDNPSVVPTVTTGSSSAVTSSSASISGSITSDGGSPILAAGFCYSTTAALPTVDDDTTMVTVTSGAFSSTITGLQSSSTYHVRAYATNAVGTAYGAVTDIATDNEAPVASNVIVSGTEQVGEELTATYTYTDGDGDGESGTLFQWYSATDGNGTGETAIDGATSHTYTLADAQAGKYIRVSVTPKAAAGTTTGTEVKSPYVGAIGEATSVTFQYNGQSVTYGIIKSNATNRKWLDRNLGASNVASSEDDFANYGDLFQWGRKADGHQLIIRAGATDGDMSGKNGTTTTLATSITPNHNQFVINGNDPNDWLATQDSTLWKGANLTNNPCPAGWRVATQGEWAAEGIASITDGYTKLKLTKTGFRSAADGSFLSSDAGGYYWTTKVDPALDATRTVRIRINASYAEAAANRAGAYAIRCTKNQ